MDSSYAPPPPPVPGKSGGKSHLWILILVGALIGIVVLGGIVAVGVFAYRRVTERRAALSAIESTARAEQRKIADSIENGGVDQGQAAIGRMKEQLEKSAAQFGGTDAAATRALAAFLGKMQAQAGQYQTAVQKLTEENIFSFNLPDQAAVTSHRQILKDFLAANAQLTDFINRSEQLIRAELSAAKVPPATLEATVKGYLKSQSESRALQLEIRRCDRVLGEAGLKILDLLEKNWGKWTRDGSGQFNFRDDATAEAFNQEVEKVQTASEEQAKAQKTMADRMRARAGQP